MSQLAFDIDAMLQEVDVAAAPTWAGAPLHFTTDFYSPAQLVAAWDRYIFENGHFDCIHASRMWHPGWNVGPKGQANGHNIDYFDVDLSHHYSCPGHGYATATPCSCVGGRVQQIICAPCQWRVLGSDENEVVEAWHDHATPGWRGLPVVPRGIDLSTMKLSARAETFLASYPADWQFAGAPIITDRHGVGTRHVPGRNIFGGYDLAQGGIK